MDYVSELRIQIGLIQILVFDIWSHFISFC